MPNHFQLEESRVVGQTLPASIKVLYSQRKVWCFVYYVQTAARPFRGPSEYSEGDFLYQDKSEGIVDQFSGEEKIFFRDRQIYFLKYHGGKVG